MDTPPRPEEEAYAGRWVVRFNGHVIAHGSSPEEARLQARLVYPKENLPVDYIPARENLTFHPALPEIMAALPPEQPLYLVGGAVRDALRHKTSQDLDLLVPQQALKIGRQLANRLGGDYVPMDAERDIARVIWHYQGEALVIDITSFRAPDLTGDLRARDFTINAIAFDIRNKQLIDPLHGAADLSSRTLRQCSSDSLPADPLRVLRAIRLAAAFDLHIEPATREAAKQTAPRLSAISPERLRDELIKILAGPAVHRALLALDLLGALPPVLPELSPLKGLQQAPRHAHDAWQHTLALIKHLENILAALAPEYDPEKASDLRNGLLVLKLGRYRQQIHTHLSRELVIGRPLRSLLFLAGLYHDTGKADTRSIDPDGSVHFRGHPAYSAKKMARRAQALAFSNAETTHLTRIVQHHMRFPNLTRAQWQDKQTPDRQAVYHFFQECGEAGVDVILLALADLRATYEQALPQDLWQAALDVARLLLENYWEKPEESVAPPRLLDGHALMQTFHLPPGPRIGALLQAIEEAQATGKVLTRSDALVFAERWLDTH